MPYRAFLEDLTWHDRWMLGVFYLATLVGAVSFLALNITLLRNLPAVFGARELLLFLFIASVQLLWGYVFFAVHQSTRIAHTISVVLFPFVFASLPAGILTYYELSEQPAARPAPVY